MKTLKYIIILSIVILNFFYASTAISAPIASSKEYIIYEGERIWFTMGIYLLDRFAVLAKEFYILPILLIIVLFIFIYNITTSGTSAFIPKIILPIIIISLIIILLIIPTKEITPLHGTNKEIASSTRTIIGKDTVIKIPIGIYTLHRLANEICYSLMGSLNAEELSTATYKINLIEDAKSSKILYNMQKIIVNVNLSNYNEWVENIWYPAIKELEKIYKKNGKLFDASKVRLPTWYSPSLINDDKYYNKEEREVWHYISDNEHVKKLIFNYPKYQKEMQKLNNENFAIYKYKQIQGTELNELSNSYYEQFSKIIDTIKIKDNTPEIQNAIDNITQSFFKDRYDLNIRNEQNEMLPIHTTIIKSKLLSPKWLRAGLSGTQLSDALYYDMVKLVSINNTHKKSLWDTIKSWSGNIVTIIIAAATNFILSILMAIASEFYPAMIGFISGMLLLGIYINAFSLLTSIPFADEPITSLTNRLFDYFKLLISVRFIYVIWQLIDIIKQSGVLTSKSAAQFAITNATQGTAITGLTKFYIGETILLLMWLLSPAISIAVFNMSSLVVGQMLGQARGQLERTAKILQNITTGAIIRTFKKQEEQEKKQKQ